MVSYVKARYGITYTVPGMHKWLHSNGFSYKKPKGRPYKADPEWQNRFIEDYEKLKKEVKAEEPIIFMDSVHPTQATKITYGWIKVGKTKQVETTASRTRLNSVGAIQLGPICETISFQYDTIHAESIVDFMGKIRAHYGEKRVHLILDRSGYHRAALVAEKAKAWGISLHFLPPYSPPI